MKYKWICFKCKREFETEQFLDTDKPTCNECFKKLLEIRTASDYYDFLGE